MNNLQILAQTFSNELRDEIVYKCCDVDHEEEQPEWDAACEKLFHGGEMTTGEAESVAYAIRDIEEACERDRGPYTKLLREIREFLITIKAYEHLTEEILANTYITPGASKYAFVHNKKKYDTCSVHGIAEILQKMSRENKAA